MNEIDIVIVSYLRSQFTLECIEHIVNRTKVYYRITLVVNGTKEHDISVIDRYKDLHISGVIDHLVLLDENYGVHAAKNIGLMLVRSRPYYIDMDNDILVPDLEPDWVTRLVELMERHPEYGAISLRPQVLIGRSGKEFDVAGEVVKFSHIGAHGRIMRTDIVKKVGGWRQVWDSKRNNEDHWIASKLASEGYLVGYSKNLRCWHLFGDEDHDPWGYDKKMKPEDHGHVERWPPVNKVGGDINNFDRKTWERSR